MRDAHLIELLRSLLVSCDGRLGSFACCYIGERFVMRCLFSKTAYKDRRIFHSFLANHLLPEIAHILLSGGVVAVPTDTLYGLACCSLSTRGIDRIYQIKGRDGAKPMAICLDKVLLYFTYHHL